MAACNICHLSSYATAPFHLVHVDISGPYAITPFHGFKYFLAILADHTRYYLLHLGGYNACYI